MRARPRSLTGLVILTLFFSTGIGGGSASAQTVEPGGNSSDTALAIQNQMNTLGSSFFSSIARHWLDRLGLSIRPKIF
jgi:hypothetical protein